jgi:hypothetical protein
MGYKSGDLYQRNLQADFQINPICRSFKWRLLRHQACGMISLDLNALWFASPDAREDPPFIFRPVQVS